MNSHRLPQGTRISFIELQTADANRLVEFYGKLLGFKIVDQRTGSVSLSATGAEPALVLLTERADAIPRPRRSTGLFHVAILFPNRKELARMFRRLHEARWPFQGFADHGVSEALYLADSDGNGIELYADRPREQWPVRNGELEMVTAELDLESLLSELSSDAEDWNGIHPRTTIGHIHLMVSDLVKAKRFYHEALGFEITQRSFPGALFVSAGGYHHHIGLNDWGSRGAPAPPSNAIGMLRFGIDVPGASALPNVRNWLERLELNASDQPAMLGNRSSVIVHDPDGLEIELHTI